LTEGYFRFRDLVIVEENKLIFRNDKLLWERILYLIIGIIGFLFCGLMPMVYIKLPLSLEDIIGFCFLIPLSVLCIVLVINVIFNTERKFVFDRLASTVTMRATVLNWRPRTITIPFADARIGATGGLMTQSVAIKLPGSKFQHLIITGLNDSTEFVHFMSCLVWFMDKNRPLPVGAEFGIYRKADYERRKAEGFPEPLYRSNMYMFDYDGDEERYTRTPDFNVKDVL